jgi:hypothetical protein
LILSKKPIQSTTFIANIAKIANTANIGGRSARSATIRLYFSTTVVRPAQCGDRGTTCELPRILPMLAILAMLAMFRPPVSAA